MIYQFPAFQEGTCLTCCKWLRREAHGLIAFGTETWNSQELHKIYHMVLWIEACQIIIKLFYTISIFGLGKRMYHTNPRTPGHKRPKQNWRTYWAFSIDPPLLPHTQPRSEFRYHWASASLPGGIHEASILESFHLNWDLNSCEFRSIDEPIRFYHIKNLEGQPTNPAIDLNCIIVTCHHDLQLNSSFILWYIDIIALHANLFFVGKSYRPLFNPNDPVWLDYLLLHIRWSQIIGKCISWIYFCCNFVTTSCWDRVFPSNILGTRRQQWPTAFAPSNTDAILLVGLAISKDNKHNGATIINLYIYIRTIPF